MKNLFVIFILAIYILSSCNQDKTRTADFNNATFISEIDVLEAIRLNDFFLDSTIKKINLDSQVEPAEITKSSSKESPKLQSYAQYELINPCIILGDCSYVKGKLNGDCLPKGPCFAIRSLEWLILYYREPNFMSKYQIRLVNLKTKKVLESIDSEVKGKLQFSSFNIGSIQETNDPLSLQYSHGGSQRNIPVNIVK